MEVGAEVAGFAFAVEVVVTVVRVGLVVQLFERRPLPLLLLAKDVNGVLELHKSCSFFVYVLPSSFGMLSRCLSSGDSFLFLMKPF
jgi:hypothetical protein